MPSRDTRSAFLQGVRQLELQLGAFVEESAYDVLEGLAVNEPAGTIDDDSVAFGFDEADGLARRLALQVPVGKWNLAPTLPAAHDLVGFNVLPPAKKHSGGQDIPGYANNEQHETTH